MGALSIRELNSNISKALARVEAGEVLVVERPRALSAHDGQPTPVEAQAHGAAHTFLGLADERFEVILQWIEPEAGVGHLTPLLIHQLLEAKLIRR